jgi:hypothetical protein
VLTRERGTLDRQPTGKSDPSGPFNNQEGYIIRISRQPTGKSNSSRSSKTDCYLASLNDDRYLSPPAGKTQHLIEFFGVCLYIEEDRLVSIGFTSLTGIGSTHCSKNLYFFSHLYLLFFKPISSDKMLLGPPNASVSVNLF